MKVGIQFLFLVSILFSFSSSAQDNLDWIRKPPSQWDPSDFLKRNIKHIKVFQIIDEDVHYFKGNPICGDCHDSFLSAEYRYEPETNSISYSNLYIDDYYKTEVKKQFNNDNLLISSTKIFTEFDRIRKFRPSYSWSEKTLDIMVYDDKNRLVNKARIQESMDMKIRWFQNDTITTSSHIHKSEELISYSQSGRSSLKIDDREQYISRYDEQGRLIQVQKGKESKLDTFREFEFHLLKPSSINFEYDNRNRLIQINDTFKNDDVNAWHNQIIRNFYFEYQDTFPSPVNVYNYPIYAKPQYGPFPVNRQKVYVGIAKGIVVSEGYSKHESYNRLSIIQNSDSQVMIIREPNYLHANNKIFKTFYIFNDFGLPININDDFRNTNYYYE